MRIATWNINGIKARLETAKGWIAQAQPDILVLQEIKSEDDAFPRAAFEDLGYNLETHGQKGFNGVALLSKRPVSDVVRGLPAALDDDQARWIEATVSTDHGALTVCGLYLPNGNPAPGDKFDYKLRWMERMRARAAELLALEEPVALMGDFNVIPQAEDCHAPENWRDDALFRPESRAAFRRLCADGWTDAVRALDPIGERFTFWDYQAGAWRRNHGIRIDHILLSPQAADRLTAIDTEREVRAREKPSDHIPVWAELDL